MPAKGKGPVQLGILEYVQEQGGGWVPAYDAVAAAHGLAGREEITPALQKSGAQALGLLARAGLIRKRNRPADSIGDDDVRTYIRATPLATAEPSESVDDLLPGEG